jgi:hypothetical protein
MGVGSVAAWSNSESLSNWIGGSWKIFPNPEEAWKIAGETERYLRKVLLLSVAMLRFVFVCLNGIRRWLQYRENILVLK